MRDLSRAGVLASREVLVAISIDLIRMPGDVPSGDRLVLCKDGLVANAVRVFQNPRLYRGDADRQQRHRERVGVTVSRSGDGKGVAPAAFELGDGLARVGAA